MIKNNRYFKRLVHLVFSIVLMTNVNIAQELNLKKFDAIKGIHARIYSEKDVNGKGCAVIIIKHNFGDSDFEIKTGKDYEKRSDISPSETWVWVSPGEYQIVISRKGYIPFQHNLRNKLEELKTYELIITNIIGTIKVSAPDAQIWLDNNLVAKDYYFEKIEEGNYVLKATRDNYNDEVKFVELNTGENLEYVFNLKPKMGKLTVKSPSSETLGASVFIDNKQVGKTNIEIPLIIGKYNLKVKKDGFIPYDQNIDIKERENNNIIATLEKDPTIYNSRFFLTYSGTLDALYGITLGILGKTGFYVSGRSNLIFDIPLYTYGDDEYWNENYENFEYYVFNDTEEFKRLSITGGLTQQLSKNLFIYFGGGYSIREYLWEIDLYSYIDDQKMGNEYILNPNNSYSGFEAEAGLIFRIKNVLISVGYTSVGFKYSDLTFGIGYNFIH